MTFHADTNELSLTPSRKCSECGFLAIRHRFNRLLLEAESTFRETAQLPPVGEGMEYEPHPVCSQGAFDIRKEIKGDSKGSVLDAINLLRECELFTDWRPGYSPREHQQMLDEKWKRERDDAERQWRRDCERQDRLWRAEQERVATSRHRQNLCIMGIGAIFIAFAGTILGSMIQAGWVQKPGADAADPAPSSAPLP